MLALMFPFMKKMRLTYVVLTITCLVNQAYVLAFLNSSVPFIPANDIVVFIVSLINSLALVYVLILMYGELRGKHWLSSTRVVKSDVVSKETITNDATK
jgi:hypothetical protein